MKLSDLKLPNLEHLYRMKVGGPIDALGLSGIGMGAMMTSPFWADVPGILPTLATAAGASWMAYRGSEPWRESPMLECTKPFKSSKQPFVASRSQSFPNALRFGYTTDKALPIWIPDEDLMRHAFVIGQSGVGKTVFFSYLMFQQIARGGGFLFIDGKLDKDNLDMLYRYCALHGRTSDLLVMNPGNPVMSNTYNPILFGDADEVAARILSLIPTTENNPGADYYKQAANQGIATLVAALQRADLAYTFIDLTILLQSPKALEHLERILLSNPRTANSEEAMNLAIFLDQYKGSPGGGKDAPKGPAMVDVKKLKDIFGGIAGRMYMFGTGQFGTVMNTYTPEINMFEAMQNNKIVYCALPTMGKDIAAANFGKMVVGDMRTAISWLQAQPKHKRPWPPYIGFFDEAGSYMTSAFSRMFEQARSAHTALIPAVQTLANFESISDELKEMVIGNTWNKLFFKIGTQASALEAGELIGKYMGIVRSLSDTSSQSSSAPTLGITPEGSGGAASGIAYGEREMEMYRVSPDDLKNLGKGEAFMTYGGKDLYNLRIPMVDIKKQFIDEYGEAKLNRFKATAFRRGINFRKDINAYLSHGQVTELENRASDAANGDDE